LVGSNESPWQSHDNAQAESFMKTLKYEEIYMRDYEALEDVAVQFTRCIDAVYNAERLHSRFGYLSLIECETNHSRQAA